MARDFEQASAPREGERIREMVETVGAILQEAISITEEIVGPAAERGPAGERAAPDLLSSIEGGIRCVAERARYLVAQVTRISRRL
jgi:hypothetical protein